MASTGGVRWKVRRRAGDEIEAVAERREERRVAQVPVMDAIARVEVVARDVAAEQLEGDRLGLDADERGLGQLPREVEQHRAEAAAEIDRPAAGLRRVPGDVRRGHVVR